VNEVIRSSGSAAVLVRTNAQTRAFEQELSSRGVPYQVVGATRFYDRAEVRDMMAYLKVLVNPSDSISLARAAATPRRGVGSKTLELFTQVCTENDLAPGVAIFDANVLGLLPARAASALRAFGDDLQTVAAAAASGGVVAAVDTIAVDVGVQPFYEAKDPQRAENIASLREAAATFTSQAQASGISQLSAFLELAALVSAADTAETQRVSLITAHAAKGREFDHVFVVGVERDLFPHRLASSPSEKVEERRLFFVAVTRPRKSLTVTHRRRRRSFTGMWENASPSMFLRDVEGIGVSMLHAAVPTRFDSRSSFLPPPSPERSVPLPQVPVSPQPRRSPRPAKEFDVIVQGTRVSHPVFGEGLVLEREDSTVTIRFADRSRRLLLEWSPLTVLN
jgi:DNA helicase-2/ATP-dependent DNA helicase PcrA